MKTNEEKILKRIKRLQADTELLQDVLEVLQKCSEPAIVNYDSDLRREAARLAEENRLLKERNEYLTKRRTWHRLDRGVPPFNGLFIVRGNSMVTDVCKWENNCFVDPVTGTPILVKLWAFMPAYGEGEEEACAS